MITSPILAIISLLSYLQLNIQTNIMSTIKHKENELSLNTNGQNQFDNLNDFYKQRLLAQESNNHETLMQLVQSPFSEVRGIIAKRSDIDVDILKMLCNDSY